MTRKHRRKVDEPRELGSGYSSRTTESHPDGEWIVQRTTGSGSTGSKRCPGCDQLIPPATPHVVAWRADDERDLENRRHWHSPCWAARDRRAPRR